MSNFLPKRAQGTSEGDESMYTNRCGSVEPGAPQPRPDETGTAPVVMLVSSSGGHLDQLMRLEPWWTELERCWVTFNLPDAQSRLADEETYWAHHPTTRNAKNFVRNLLLAQRLIRSKRPDLVVSTGAAVAYPFFLVARAHGIKTVFLEVYDRVSTATLTGRLCRPVTDAFLVQWPSQQELYPGSTFIGSVYP